ncbi:hypothetical protein Tco_0882392 [Tanacetum coccineum]
MILRGDILFLENLLKDEPSKADKSEIYTLIGESPDTFLIEDEEIELNPFQDIDDSVLIPRVSVTPLDSLNSFFDSYDTSYTNPSELDFEYTLNYDNQIFNIQNEHSDEPEIETIMDERREDYKEKSFQEQKHHCLRLCFSKNKQKWVKGQDIPLNPNTHLQLLHQLKLNQSLFRHHLNLKIHTNVRSLKRVTKIPQSSEPTNLVADEAVTKEWEDKMERAATTASSLEAEQDSGNINKTQSMATLNEPSP